MFSKQLENFLPYQFNLCFGAQKNRLMDTNWFQILSADDNSGRY